MCWCSLPLWDFWIKYTSSICSVLDLKAPWTTKGCWESNYCFHPYKILPCHWWKRLQWHQCKLPSFVQRQIWTEKRWYYRDSRKFFWAPSLEHLAMLITNFLWLRHSQLLYCTRISFFSPKLLLSVDCTTEIVMSPEWRVLEFIQYFFAQNLTNHLTDGQKVVFSSEVGRPLSVEFVS